MLHATPKQLYITVPTFRVQPNPYGLLPGTSLEIIGWKSPRQYRLAAERLARYFAREEGYSLPYWHNENYHDPEAHRDRILLWTQRHYTLDEKKLTTTRTVHAARAGAGIKMPRMVGD